ncbi:limbic system-associated membrane protein-like isoform X2 [Stylophora pistillata]|uniref:limbic system-associated membrane protein-like isoform X2 n=1 Tax=Stylophora pistillata TaxID=50429 RepID=UPI000C03E34C|nr:limbic system-associated membrane protein-like isoform X2 [Stylophora pistillata]
MCKAHLTLQCFLTTFVIIPSAEAYVHFTVTPSDPTYVNNGSTAKLAWDYSDPNNDLYGIVFSVLVKRAGFKRMLYKENGIVKEHQSLPSAYKGRVRIEGRAILVIEKITPQDNTKFVCQLVDGAADPESQVHLIVAEPPKISLSSVQGSYREGAFVNVNCTASGIPEPAVTWIRDGTAINAGKGAALLKFNRLRRTDDGWYLCVANNTADTIINHSVLLVYYPPIIENVTISSSKSSIGHTVTLKCSSDGVPTPILTWYKPNGMKIHRIRARENKAQVTLRKDQDFEKPGAPSIVSSEDGIQASSLTVRWTAPVDDGGSPITGYTVIILKGDTEINSVNISDPVKTSYIFWGLERATNYAVQLFARNAIFEGDPVVTSVKTRFEGPPAFFLNIWPAQRNNRW